MYRWLFGDLRTGKIHRTVDLRSHSWSIPLVGAGSLGGKFPLASGEWPTAASDSAPAKQFIAVEYVAPDGTATMLEGGPVWATEYTRSSGVLDITGAGLWTLFDHRKLVPILREGMNVAEQVIQYETAELALIAKRLIADALKHTGGDLPIVFPSDAALGGEGRDRVRNYEAHELGWVGERLKQLTEVIEGPEVQFIPRRRADDERYIEWVMRIGTESTPPVVPADGEARPAVFDARVASFNYQGLTTAANFNTRFNEIIQRMAQVKASVINAQEADSSKSPGQAFRVRDALNAYAGSSGQWDVLIGRNLNVTFVDCADINPLWRQVKNFHLGDNKYLTALLVEDKAGGGKTLICNLHMLTASQLTKQIAATIVAIRVLDQLAADYDVPIILTGDFNAKDEDANRPMGMLTRAGYIDVRTMVNPADIVNGDYNSHDSYGENGRNGWWIDQVRVKGGAKPTKVGLLDTGTASDHNIVWADIFHESQSAQIVTKTGKLLPPNRLIFQQGAPHVFDTSAREGKVRELVVDTDGSSMANRWWAAGEGEGAGRPIAYSATDELLNLGYPLLEDEVGSTDSVSRVETLKAKTDAALLTSQRPIQTWSLDVETGNQLAVIRPGDWSLIRVIDDHFIPDGEYEMRVVGMSGKAGGLVALDLAPRLGEI